jgi:mannose-6-phosphate isomerase-like protein (cupin superfamily)
MSKRTPDALESLADSGRRTLLGISAAGAAALIAPALGAIFAASDADAAQSAVPVPPAAARIRRVVTGLNGAGKSYIAVDDQVPATSIFTTSATAPLGKATEGESHDVGKATSETRLFVAAIAPSKDPKPDLKNRIGFHQTMGIAYCYILNGEVAFLTDTQETTVKAGDVVVERHTWHSWRNEGTDPVRMLITVVTTA